MTKRPRVPQKNNETIVEPSLEGSPDRPPPRLFRQTLQDGVYGHLREWLMSGEFEPGDRLTVRGIATRMGTSIMPVREAFRRLHAEGGLELLSNGIIQVPVLNQAKIEELTEIRLAIEGLATRLAAQRNTPANISVLQDCHAVLEARVDSNDLVAIAKANERFHFAVYSAAQSSELLRIIENLWLRMGPYLLWLLKHELGRESKRSTLFRHHREIIRALSSHDPNRAEAALRADLSGAAKAIVDGSKGARDSRR